MSIANIKRELSFWAYEKELGILSAKANIGASGAVTLAGGGGLASIVKQATAGQYVVTLITPFPHLMSVNAQVVAASITGVAKVQLLADPATLQASFRSTGSFTIQCVDNAGAAVNPPSGSQIVLDILVRATSSRVAAWSM